MASNDSGVDTSNDSNDSTFIIKNPIELPNVFENNEKHLEGFALPQALSLYSTKPSCLPSCSHSYKVKTKSRSKSRRDAISNMLLTESKERKLRLAASTANIELLTRLLESGTNPNCSDEHKRSPLHLAACRGYADIVTQLLKYGANPNIVDSLGNTPLHLAVISASSNNFNLVVRTLLKAGASVHTLDRSGKNPLELAESKLRLMRFRYKNPTPDTNKIMEDMCLLISVILMHFFKEQRDINELAALEKRLQNLSTDDQVANEADALLARVERLSITK